MICDYTFFFEKKKNLYSWVLIYLRARSHRGRAQRFVTHNECKHVAFKSFVSICPPTELHQVCQLVSEHFLNNYSRLSISEGIWGPPYMGIACIFISKSASWGPLQTNWVWTALENHALNKVPKSPACAQWFENHHPALPGTKDRSMPPWH